MDEISGRFHPSARVRGNDDSLSSTKGDEIQEAKEGAEV